MLLVVTTIQAIITKQTQEEAMPVCSSSGLVTCFLTHTHTHSRARISRKAHCTRDCRSCFAVQ